MSQQQLNNLLTLHIHQDTTDLIDPQAIIKLFAQGMTWVGEQLFHQAFKPSVEAMF